MEVERGSRMKRIPCLNFSITSTFLTKLIVIKTEAHPNCIGLSLNSVSHGKHETTKEMASQWNGLLFSFPGVLLVDLCFPQFHLNCICHLYLNRIWHNNIIVNWYVIFFLFPSVPNSISYSIFAWDLNHLTLFLPWVSNGTYRFYSV